MAGSTNEGHARKVGCRCCGDLPYIGALFTSSCDVCYTEHVMLLVTPHVVVIRDEEAVMPPPGGQETSEALPVPPAPPTTTPKANVEKKVAKLLKKYEKACKKGDLVLAKKYARRAISLATPTCFSRSRRTNASENPRDLSDRLGISSTGQPSRMTYDRVHGGVE